MAIQAKSIVVPYPKDPLTVIADQGYYRGEELLACEKANIIAYIAKSDTLGKRSKGEFNRNQFRYITDDDEYDYPAGERLSCRFTREEAGKMIRRYWSSACVRCSIKSQCTPGDYRCVSRWEQEAVVEAAAARLADRPDVMRIRRASVEHPFGTLKAWMGATIPLASAEL
jgi:transposase